MSYTVQGCNGEESARILRALFEGEAAGVINDGPRVTFKGHIDVVCRNADGSVAWQESKSNIVTDYGRRKFLDGAFTSLGVVTSPSRETPLVERYSHFDNGSTSAGQQVANVTATVDATTLTRTWSTTFATPAAKRTVSLIGLGTWSNTVGAYALYAYTLLPIAKTQDTTQTLELVYKVTLVATAGYGAGSNSNAKVAIELVKYNWVSNDAGLWLQYFPWRTPVSWFTNRVRSFYVGQDVNSGTTIQYVTRNGGAAITTADYRRLRTYNATALSRVQGSDSGPIGGIVAIPAAYAGGRTGWTSANTLAYSEVATTQIGPSYVHPPLTGTVNTALGASYVTGFTNNPGQAAYVPHGTSYIRIESGADKGAYFVRLFDNDNSRLYLTNLDGTPFVAKATATVSVSCGIRMNFFNESNVIPNSVGQYVIDGAYQPGESREHYIARVRYERTGNTTAGYTQGSYWFSLRPWRFGDGLLTGNASMQEYANLYNQRIDLYAQSSENFGPLADFSAGFVGGSPPPVLDTVNQRLWGIATDGTNGDIWWWLYKSPECFHEVATSTGTPSDPLAGITMTGSRPVDIRIGSDNTVYVALVGGANAGWLAIKADMSVTQVRLADVDLTGATIAGIAVDRASARTSGASPDRIYLFFNDATTNVNKVRYFESTSFGTLQTVAVTMTGGVTTYTGDRPGCRPVCNVDQSNGTLLWSSTDGGVQLNIFVPGTTTWSRRPIADFAGLNGGSSTTGFVNPATIYAIGVNHHPSFREVWLGTNNGHVKLNADDLTGAYSKYFGYPPGITNPVYSVGGLARPVGTVNSNASSFVVRGYSFGVDGRVFAFTQGIPNKIEALQYSREGDCWVTGNGYGDATLIGSSSYSVGMMSDNYGTGVIVMPYNKGTSSVVCRIFAAEIHYQYISSSWTPKEVVRGALPDSVSSPGCSAKPFHTALEPLVMGLYIRFVPQGGATPHTTEYLGRAAQTAAQRTDGSTTNGAATFGGSGFVLNDVGRLLRIESGANQGVYTVTAYTNANQVTLAKLDGTAFSGSATVGTLSYSMWEIQAGAGPECISFYLAAGYAQDPAQDISGIFHEAFWEQTAVSDNTEPVKFCLPLLGPAGSTGPAAYFENYPANVSNNYNPGLPAHLALPGSPFANGEQLLKGLVDNLADGTNGRPNTSSYTTWGGRSAVLNGTTGWAFSVDFGAAVEVGRVVARFRGNASPPNLVYSETQAQGGFLGVVYNAPAGSAPGASSTSRTSGANGLNTTAGNTTVTLTTGDFLGSLTASATDGATAATTNTFNSSVGFFQAAHVGQALKVIGGTDNGTYRILTVAPDGSSCTVRNLDQTAKSFSSSASSLTFEVRDAVRHEDMLQVGAHKLCVERLLTTTTAQVRVAPSTTLTNQSWSAIIPTWRRVKRISPAVDAQPPEETNNSTYLTLDGREANDNADVRAVVDLSALSTTERTGQFWKLAVMPRHTGLASGAHQLTSLAFYDPAGKLIGVVADQKLDSVDSYADFLACRVTRLDFIQATSSAASHVAGCNGNASLGGTSGDTVTLAGSNRFLGFQVKEGAGGNAPGGSAVFNCAGGDTAFTAADVGRLLRVKAGANVGYFRIATLVSATQVTLLSPGGSPVTLNADAGPTGYAVHEGINAGSDYITLGGTEYPIGSVSDDLKTLTLAEKRYITLPAQAWEIRRRALPSTSTAVDASTPARLLYTQNSAPLQPGDVCQDSRGSLEFHPLDVGSPLTRTDGASASTSSTFTGSGFTPDDVGRGLLILGGADKGAYRIASYVSATQVTLSNIYTGGAQTLTATASGISYKVVADRRFRAARYITIRRA